MFCDFNSAEEAAAYYDVEARDFGDVPVAPKPWDELSPAEQMDKKGKLA